MKELSGGTANPGQVLREGDTVRRPAHPASGEVQRFLAHLHQSGITRVPRPLGFDEAGREVLSFVEGEVDHPPFGNTGRVADWVVDDAVLLAVAELQRDIHIAARGFDPNPDTRWATTGGDYFPPGAEGALLCHNDICVSNIVVRDGLVVGLIDFDYLKPVNRLFDIAVAARHWVPLVPPADRPRGWEEADAADRFSMFAEVHQLDRAERLRTVELATEFLSQARTNVRRLADEGHAGFARLMDEGYVGYNKRSVSWLLQNGSRIAS